MDPRPSLHLGDDDKKFSVFPDNCGCQLCFEKPAKYTCPRCNVQYCSLACYRCEKHLKCSEIFYKNCVTEALKDDMIDKEGKQKMVEMLKRYQEDQSEGFLDEEDADDLEQRLEGLNLDKDTEKIWEKLTTKEKQEFEKVVDNGYIGSLMAVWVPWWINNRKRPSSDNSFEMKESKKTGTSALPNVLKNIPHLEGLIRSKQPSGDTKYNLINILYAYAYICRLYNGSYYEFIPEASEGLWRLSAVLCHSVNFDSIDSSLRSAVKSSMQHQEYFNSEEFSLSVIQDISLLLKGDENSSGKHFVNHALSDAYRLLGKGVDYNKKCDVGKSLESNGSKNIGKSLWHAKKKVHFMLAWFHENQNVCLSLEPFLIVVKEAMKEEFKQLHQEKLLVEKSRVHVPFKSKQLIEEI